MPQNRKYTTKRKRAPSKKLVTAAGARKIAKSVMAAAPERKFMDSNSFTQLTPKPIAMDQRDGVWVPISRTSVIAFSNTVNSVGNGVIQTYGTNGIDGTDNPMLEMEMTRPFQPQGANNVTPYHIEGKKIKPVSAINKWRISRDIGQLLTGFYLNHQASGGNEQLTIPPTDLAANLPVICRMIRVCPKLNQTKNICFPASDVFVDTYNNATGVEDPGFDENEMLQYRINRRKYDVVEDKFFRIQNGLTVQWQRSVWADGVTNSRAFVQPIITNTNANCEKLFTTSHMLTARKNGQLHYNNPTLASSLAADSGQKREYTLLHFCYAGAETFLNSETATAVCPLDLRVSTKNTVQFTDL